MLDNSYSAFHLKMHFFLEAIFLSFFSGSILCWRLTIGPSVASSSRGRVINIFVRNDSDILYAPDEGNNSVWPLVRHHQEEKKRTLWPKRVNRNAVAAATLAFVFFLVNLGRSQKICRISTARQSYLSVIINDLDSKIFQTSQNLPLMSKKIDIEN